MALVISTAPATEPISTATAKSHLRVDISDDDTLIDALVKSARGMAETITRRALITQTWDYILDEWPAGDEIEIPLPPLQSITHIKYKDENGDESTMTASDYIVDIKNEPGRIVLASGATWPSGTLYPVGAITIRFVAGYGVSGSSVPQPILQAMLLDVGHLYENREATVGVGNVQMLPRGIMELLWPYRVLRFS